MAGEIRGLEEESEAGAEAEPDHALRPEEHPAAERQEERHAAKQQGRLYDVAQLVTAALLLVQRREAAMGAGRADEHDVSAAPRPDRP
jgi:hypothetical protein